MDRIKYDNRTLIETPGESINQSFYSHIQLLSSLCLILSNKLPSRCCRFLPTLCLFSPSLIFTLLPPHINFLFLSSDFPLPPRITPLFFLFFSLHSLLLSYILISCCNSLCYHGATCQEQNESLVTSTTKLRNASHLLHYFYSIVLNHSKPRVDRV